MDSLKRHARSALSLAALGLVVAGCAATVTAPSPARSLDAELAAFTGSSWPQVSSAKERLESLQSLAIPELLVLTARVERVKLVDTADLIYPGASTFYGHGYIVDYDIDSISARAGWLLEELTFQNFGFSSGSISEPPLLEAASNGKRDVPLAEVLPRSTPRPTRAAASAAKAWWLAHSSGWTRLSSLTEALASTDSLRQMSALSWLRYGKTACDGLTPRSFDRSIRPLVEAVAESASPEVQEQALLLLKDTELEWWRYKTGHR